MSSIYLSNFCYEITCINIVIDQWMLDFKSHRKFYVFPLKSSLNY
jgi:hypothetical protein